MNSSNNLTPEQKIDEILGIELKDYGCKVLKLIDVNLTKQQLLSLIQEEMKRMVVSSKPDDKPYLKGDSDERYAGASAWNSATRQYQENMLQALKQPKEGTK